jgi:glycosyltransferase involved in cell wall biosynthesis
LVEARRRGIPTVLEVNAVHSAPQRCEFEPLALRRLAERLERRAFELASVIVTVSTPLARQVRSLAAANVVVLPNGANPYRFDVRHADRAGVRARLGLGDRLTIGWAGILREWHGLDLLLEATVALPDARLLVVGDGPARATLEQRATSLGLGGRLVITGRVAYAEMPDYVAAMDIAVVSDERTGVASPMKLLEYMAMSRAVLAPRLENISDIVRHDGDALLFTPGSARDLSNMLRLLAENPGLRNELGKRARATVERERNWRRIAETVLTLPGVQGRDRVSNSAL